MKGTAVVTKELHATTHSCLTDVVHTLRSKFLSKRLRGTRILLPPAAALNFLQPLWKTFALQSIPCPAKHLDKCCLV